MTTQPLHVLLVEDNATDAELALHQLRRDGFHPLWQRVETRSDYLAHLDEHVDLILADYSLPQLDGLSALKLLRESGLDIPFILLSGTIGEDIAVECMREGADDFLLKDRLGRLGPAVTRALQLRALRVERRHTEQRMRRLNEVLQAVRHINGLMVRERDPQRLLVRACEILLSRREYRMVWIGLVEPPGYRLRPAAAAGIGTAYLDQIVVTWDDTPTGHGPTGTAVRTRQTQVCHDIANDPRMGPWQAAAVLWGFASSAAAPMLSDDRLFGALTVYAEVPNAFDAEEVGILTELASDLAFALHSIEAEQARQQVEKNRCPP